MASPSVPKELAFHLQQAESAAARAYTVRQSPFNNQTFKSQSLIKLSLPSSHNSFFDPKKSFLRFKVNVPSFASGNNPSTSSVAFDGHAAACIKTLISIGGNGQQIENFENYNIMHLALLDAQCSLDSRISGAQSICGGSAAGDHGGALIAAGASETFVLPLVSGVFGAQCDTKMIPISALTSGLELNLILADFKDCFKFYHADGTIRTQALLATGNDPEGLILAASITISDVEYCAHIVELNPAATQAIANINQNMYVCPNMQYRCINQSIPTATSGTTTLSFNHSMASLKALFVAIIGPNSGSVILNSISGRTKNTLGSWNFRINGIQVPGRPVSALLSGADTFIELEKCFSSVNNVMKETSITRAQWMASAAGVQTGSFLIGLSTDVFAFGTDSPARAGISTRASPIMLDLNWSAATTEALQIYCFAAYDSRLIIDGNTRQIIEEH
jgi:hypothetical protein